MGRTRNKKQLLARAAVSGSSPKPSNKPTITSLIEKTQELILECDYDLAKQFIHRILERDPGNVVAKEMLGVSQLETGELQQAKQTFSTLLPPHVTTPPPSAHLYMAQLTEDDPRLAIQHYQAAIDILSSQLKGKERAINFPSAEDDAEIKNNIVRALIGQVEIWMDPSYDLCFEQDAEEQCENLLNLALQTDPGNSEALQALASVRLSQQRPEEAKECLEKSWSVWKDLDLDDPQIPPIPARLFLVKLLIEVTLFAPALLVLHGIMASDDQDVEAWYLEGWCYFLMAEQAQSSGNLLDDISWEELARDSRERLETCQQLHRNEDNPDLPLLEHVQELISKLQGMGITVATLDEDLDNGEGWEDVDSSEDEEGDVEMS